MGVAKLSEPGALADYIVGNIPLDYPQKQEVYPKLIRLREYKNL